MIIARYIESVPRYRKRIQLATGLRTLAPTIYDVQVGKKGRLKNDFKCLYNEVARHRESEERPLLAPAQDNKATIAGDYRNSRFGPSQFAYY